SAGAAPSHQGRPPLQRLPAGPPAGTPPAVHQESPRPRRARSGRGVGRRLLRTDPADHLGPRQARPAEAAARCRDPRFRPPAQRVMEILRGLAGEGERLALMGDDGEKFGSWPTTHEACWDRGWVDEFFNAIEASAGWLDTVLPGAYVETHRPHGPVYLPATS